MMGWYVTDHMSGWSWAGTVLSTLLLVALLTAAGLLLVRSGRRPDATPPRSPEQVLADRYARGEIDEQELRHRLDTLREIGIGTR
jgi:putative membrane protein